MPVPTEDVTCNSILREHLQDGTPWNHLCVLDRDHEGRHRCWSTICERKGWTEAESSGRVPFKRVKHSQAHLVKAREASMMVRKLRAQERNQGL